jgi:hypothetical protein
MVYVCAGELQWLDLFSHTFNDPGWGSLFLESADLELGRIWAVEHNEELQHDRRRLARPGYIGHTHGKRRDELQPDLHLEPGDGFYLVSILARWSERECDPAMVYICPGELQRDDLLSDTGNNAGRRHSLYLEGADLQLIREWTVEQYDELQHFRFRTAGGSNPGHSHGKRRDEL